MRLDGIIWWRCRSTLGHLDNVSWAADVIPDVVSRPLDGQGSRLESDRHRFCRLMNWFWFTDGIRIQGRGWGLPSMVGGSRKELWEASPIMSRQNKEPGPLGRRQCPHRRFWLWESRTCMVIFSSALCASRRKCGVATRSFRVSDLWAEELGETGCGRGTKDVR